MTFFTPSFFQLRKVGFILVALFAVTSAFAQNATNGGEIATNQTICPGETPDPFTSNEPASGGNTNLAIEYLWMAGSSANFPSGYVNAPGVNNGLTYNAPAVGVTTYFIRCARRDGYTQFQAESNIVLLTVLASPTATINGAPTAVTYSGSTVTLTADFAANSTYSWDMNGNGSTNCSNSQSCSYTYSTPGTYTATLTVTNANGCVAVTSVTITVEAPNNANIQDPCFCGNVANIFTATGYYNSDYILVNSAPGQTWFYTNTGATVYNQNLNPIPNGTQLTETQPGVYYLPLWFEGGTSGWSGSASNGSLSLATGPGPGLVCPPCANPLPVDLISFEANIAGTDVQLKWATASETNNSHFELERSLDGIRFDVITKVEGAGSSTNVQTYSFMDKDALAGTNYYRLTQVDLDGTSEAFTVVTAKIETGQTVVHVLPNPVKDVARVRLEGTVSNNAIYNLVSVTGQLVKSVNVTNVGGIQEINLADVQAGVYFLQVIDGTETQVIQKVIKL